MVLLAVKQWHGRPRAGSDPALPTWLTVIDSITPAKAGARPTQHAKAAPGDRSDVVRHRLRLRLGHLCPPHQLLAPAVRAARSRRSRRWEIANAPEWNVRLRPWGGREGHDYGRNDQS